MYTIALIAQKGGTGKTTLCLSLAVAAVQAGKRVVVFDTDPQATACNWSDRRTLENVVVLDAQPGRLPTALAKAKESDVDLVLIDTPARSEQSALAAAKVADLVVIPCRPQAYDLETIPAAREIVALSGGKLMVVVLNAVPAWGNRHEQAIEVLGQMEMPVCPALIGQRAAFGDSGALGQTPTEFEPKGKAAEEIRAVYEYIYNLVAFATSSKGGKHGQSRSRGVAQ
jgi:chromosome partitioning protein